MKRLAICIVIFSMIIAAAALSVAALKGLNKGLENKVTAAVNSALEGDKGAALYEVQKLNVYWESYYRYASYLVQKGRLEDISYAVYKLAPLLEGDSEEFFSECEMIIYSAWQLYENELPKLSSVL